MTKNFFVIAKLAVSFVMATSLMIGSIGCSKNKKPKKPKEAIIKERQEIMRYLERRNPNDVFKFAYSSMDIKFDPDKPYQTGFKNFDSTTETYGIKSKLLFTEERSEFDKDFWVEVVWDDDWQQVSVQYDTYAIEMLALLFKQDISKVLTHPQNFNVYVEEDLLRRVRERVQSFADARALMVNEKESLTFYSKFSESVTDEDAFNDLSAHKAKLITYIQAVGRINDCHNQVTLNIRWKSKQADTTHVKVKMLSAKWSSGALEGVDTPEDYIRFLEAHMLPTMTNEHTY